MKKMLAASIVAVMSVTAVMGVGAETKRKVDNSDGIKIYINDEKMEFPAEPYIQDGTTMVPMRVIFERLGATVEYNAKTKIVTAKKSDTVITLEAGSTAATLNGKKQTLGAPVTNIDGNTMIPLRFVSEALGAEVAWDRDTQTVDITKKEDSTYRKTFESRARTIEQYEEDKLDKATTQLQINKETDAVAKMWEKLRKDLYNHLKLHLSPAKFSQLNVDETAWAADKNKAVEEEGAKWEEGTNKTAAQNRASIKATKERCYTLINMVE